MLVKEKEIFVREREEAMFAILDLNHDYRLSAIYLLHPLKSSKLKERLYGSPLVWSHPEESILFAYRPHI
jgi:hypothetical protein